MTATGTVGGNVIEIEVERKRRDECPLISRVIREQVAAQKTIDDTGASAGRLLVFPPILRP